MSTASSPLCACADRLVGRARMMRMLYHKCWASFAEVQDDYGGQLQNCPLPLGHTAHCRRAGHPQRAPALPRAAMVLCGGCRQKHSLKLENIVRRCMTARSFVSGLACHHWPPQRIDDDLDIACQLRQCLALRWTRLGCRSCLVLRRSVLPSQLGCLDRMRLRGPHDMPLFIHDHHSQEAMLFGGCACWDNRISLATFYGGRRSS